MYRALFIGALLLSLATITPGGAQGNADKTTTQTPSLEKVAQGVWLHKSYEQVAPWGMVLSQGLAIETEDGALLVDTAWNNTDTKELLALIKKELGRQVTQAITTHAHQDKMGGVDALHENSVHTIAHQFSNEDAPLRRLTPAKQGLHLQVDELFLISSHDHNIRILYPGAGHTRDNIVVYHPPSKTLFGGCLIRPGSAKGLGNTADGDIAHWADAIRNVAKAFPEAEIVIPSHGPPGGRDLFDHTINLAEEALAEAANE